MTDPLPSPQTPMIEAFRDRYLIPTIQFWNATFLTKRNAMPMTGQLFRQRILEIESVLGRFEPEGLLLALERDRVVGMVHLGRRSETLCERLFEPWSGGEQGYIALLAVHPDHRRRGIGTALMEAALERLTPCPTVVLDGQCFNPFYGNADQPVLPLWGSTEGIGLEAAATGEQSFFARFGFTPRFEAVSLERELSTLPDPPDPNPAYTIQTSSARHPVLDTLIAERNETADEHDAFSTLAVHDGRIAGLLTVYPMTPIAADRYAIYLLEVSEHHRGRGLGRSLLHHGLQEMARRGGTVCEVLTLPSESPAALALYQGTDFHTIQSWVVY